VQSRCSSSSRAACSLPSVSTVAPTVGEEPPGHPGSTDPVLGLAPQKDPVKNLPAPELRPCPQPHPYRGAYRLLRENPP
jgi:hypothetical protein